MGAGGVDVVRMGLVTLFSVASRLFVVGRGWAGLASWLMLDGLSFGRSGCFRRRLRMGRPG